MTNAVYLRLVILLAATLIAGPAFADDGDIPDNLQGTWAINGACDNPARTIDIIGNTLAIGTGAPAVVTYAQDDSPNGNDAIHFTDEGDVSNFEYIGSNDALAYHEEGYGMGRVVGYTRCGDDQAQSQANEGSQQNVDQGGGSGGNTTNDNSQGSDDQADNTAGAAPIGPAQTRCGWLTELSDGNINFIDGDGSWILQQDGDSSVDGMDNIGELSIMPHVSTGNGHGYACVCIQAHLGAGDVGIAEIDSLRAKPIRQCKADSHLSDPSTW